MVNLFLLRITVLANLCHRIPHSTKPDQPSLEAGDVCGTAYHSEDELWLTISTIGPRKEEKETWILRTAQILNSILPKHMGLGWRKG